MSDMDEETRTAAPEIDYVKQHDAALKAVSDAKRKYNLDIAAANTDVVKAKSKYQARIDKTARELDKIQAVYSSKVASYFGITLYKDRISNGVKEIRLTDGVKVRIETKGAIVSSDGVNESPVGSYSAPMPSDGSPSGDYASAPAATVPVPDAASFASSPAAPSMDGTSIIDSQTETATGYTTPFEHVADASTTGTAPDETIDETGTVLEPEVIERPEETLTIEPVAVPAPAEVSDTRELYIHVESNTDSFSVKCDPDKGEEAKHFMQQITDMVAGAKERDDEKNAKLSECNARIEALRADTAAVDDARSKLESITNDTGAIAAAQEALRTLEFNASIDQKTAYAMRVAHKAKMEKITIAIIIAVIVIVLAIVIILVGKGR